MSQRMIGQPMNTGSGPSSGMFIAAGRFETRATGQTIVATDMLAASEQLNGMIETNANIQPGDSGGPLVNDSGEIIGIDTAGV